MQFNQFILWLLVALVCDCSRHDAAKLLTSEPAVVRRGSPPNFHHNAVARILEANPRPSIEWMSEHLSKLIGAAEQWRNRRAQGARMIEVKIWGLHGRLPSLDRQRMSLTESAQVVVIFLRRRINEDPIFDYIEWTYHIGQQAVQVESRQARWTEAVRAKEAFSWASVQGELLTAERERIHSTARVQARLYRIRKMDEYVSHLDHGSNGQIYWIMETPIATAYPMVAQQVLVQKPPSASRTVYLGKKLDPSTATSFDVESPLLSTAE